jgi:hypothetical protein
VISLVATLIAGCGGETVAPDTDNSAERFSGDRGRAAQVVEDFSASVAAGDWSHICDDLYTRTEARPTAGLLGDTCEDELE